ncbi:MAG: autotransporter outer membrane beta-barrel domain-containing protein [Gammaproteobacteria bacterium]|nr:autotransporter outer membrane beta-barrel domain-containing protein [Gammaproteobacteria bacterium]
MIKKTITRQPVLLIGIAAITSGITTNLMASTPINQTKINMADTIGTACAQGPDVNDADFQTRCNNIVIASGGNPFILENVVAGGENLELTNAINEVAPEQLIVPSLQSTRTMANIASVSSAAIAARMNIIRTAMFSSATTQVAANNQSQPGQFKFSLNPGVQGGSAGISDSGRLGIWGNGTYNTGDVNSSVNQLGFGFENWGGTIGADYRITDNFVAGAAFTYLSTDADVDASAGSVESDSYSGTIYATFAHESGFYVDANASYGESDLDISRRIDYSINGDTVNTNAEGNPDGSQYSFGMGIGYQISLASATIEPFARADYMEYEIDSYSERGGQGWGSRFSRQRFRSLPTTVGLRLSNAFSMPWGVLLPQIHGAWHHQFKDDARTITTSFLGDGNSNQFSIVTEGPDRDYYTAGASLSATFAGGVTAFVAYNTLQGYRDVDSHRFTFGGRLEF